MAPPVTVMDAPEVEVELWAKDAGGKTRMDTIRKTFSKRNA
jgi:hypothetical protein